MTEKIKKANALIQSIYKSMTDPTFTKSDILALIKSNTDNDKDLQEIFGKITDDMIEEIREDGNAVNDMITAPSVTYDDDGQFQILDISKMDKKVKSSFIEIPSIEEARFLYDIYYQAQSKRIIAQNQLRSLNQKKDSEIDDNEQKSGSKNRTFLEWYFYNSRLMETEISKAIEAFSDSCYLSNWAKQIIGIGPIFATCIAANLKIDDDAAYGPNHQMSAGNWWSFCGLNDNKRPWLGKAKSAKIVQDLIEENNGIIDDELVIRLSTITGWNMRFYEEAKRENGTWNKDKLISISAKIPYNKKLKTICYNIGKSFMFNSKNDDSLYGKIYRERKQYEQQLNEQGAYADQAAEILKNYNYKKNTVAYKYYSKGQLPPAHIDARARRYAVKLFISHCFEAAYYNKYGKPAPMPYVIAYQGHKDYIPPEVPYELVPRDCE